MILEVFFFIYQNLWASWPRGCVLSLGLPGADGAWLLLLLPCRENKAPPPLTKTSKNPQFRRSPILQTLKLPIPNLSYVSGCPLPARPRAAAVVWQAGTRQWSRAWPTSSASGASSGADPSGRSSLVRAAGSSALMLRSHAKAPTFALARGSDDWPVCLALLLQVLTCRPTSRSRLSWWVHCSYKVIIRSMFAFYIC